MSEFDGVTALDDGPTDGFGDGGGGGGSGFSIDLPGVNGVTSDMSGLVSSGSGLAGDLSSQVLDGSAFAGIGSGVAAANSCMQDGLSNGLSQTMGLLGTLNTNVQCSATGYAQLDSAIASGFGGLSSGNGSGSGLLTDGVGGLGSGNGSATGLLTDSVGGPGSGDASGTLLADANADPADPFQPAAPEPATSTLPSIPARGTAPGTVNDWWKGLTLDQQQQITAANPAAIGALDGVPAAVRDYANQQVLPGLISQTQTQITSLQNTVPAPIPGDETGMAALLGQQQQISALQTRLSGLQALQNQVEPWNGFPDQASAADPQNFNGHFLLGLDTNSGGDGTVGHFIMSVNNPDYARNVATLVPGVGTNLSQSTVNDYVGYAGNLVNSSNAAAPSAQNSAVVWANYNAPQIVLPDAAEKGFAIAGAPTLDRFQDGLYDTNTNGFGLNTTVIGHSYGSVVVGEATQQQGGLDANTVVAIGSPGMDVNNVSNLLAGMRQQDALTPQAPQVFASRNPSDIIVFSDGVNIAGLGHGTDPVIPAFGAQTFDSGTGPGGSFAGTSVAGHMFYFQPGTPGMQNMGQIITRNFQNVTPEPPPKPLPAPVIPPF